MIFDKIIKDEIKIGKWTKIGAGTILIDDADSKKTYVGVPGVVKN